MADQTKKENNQEKRVYWSEFSSSGKNLPLEQKSIAVSGSFDRISKRISKNGKVYLETRFKAVIGDKTVEENFGKEYVNENHEVVFRVPVYGYAAKNMIDYPPCWGQTIVLHMTGLQKNEFTKRDGTTDRTIERAWANGAPIGTANYLIMGSTQGRTPYTIFDNTNQDAAGNNNSSNTFNGGSVDTSCEFTELTDYSEDDDLPF